MLDDHVVIQAVQIHHTEKHLTFTMVLILQQIWLRATVTQETL